jgi:hypothetical protein
MSITFPETKTIKEEIREAIGRNVDFILVGSGNVCPVCSSGGLFDEVNQTSLDSFCEVCFKEDTLVNTTEGFKNIQDIILGDTVYSSSGNKYKVINTFSRDYTGIMVSIETYKNIEGVECTGNHTFKVLEKYKYPHSCRNIQCLPTCTPRRGCYYSRQPKDGRFKIVDKAAIDIEVGDTLLYPICDVKKYSEICFSNPYKYHEKEYSYAITEDLVYLIGWFIAEGCVSNDEYPRTVQFALNKDEKDVADRISKICKELFNANSRLTSRTENSICLEVHSSKLCLLLKKCGNLAENKIIPKEFINTDFNDVLVKALVDGDGHKDGNEYTFTTVSKILSYQLFDLLVRCGYKPYIFSSESRTDAKGIHHLKSYHVGYRINSTYSRGSGIYNGYYMMVVKAVSSTSRTLKVYNIEVEGSHTYTANLFGVNNCSGLYYLPSSNSTVTIKSHVRWLSGDILEHGIAGSTLAGDCIITISNDDLTEEQLDIIKEIHVDDRILYPQRITKKGIPNVDRLRIVAKEGSKE